MEKFTLFLSFLFCLFFETGAQVVYVHHGATGLNDGASWENAYTSLKEAISNASEGDEVWVAAGTYLPGSAPNATFLLNKDLTLLGGFNGTESSADQRDPDVHVAILSGDVEGNDIEGNLASNRGDNLMTIMTIFSSVTEASLIDGFTFQNGQADGNLVNQEQRGGAVHCAGNPTFRNCRFLYNYSEQEGGAVYLSGANARGVTFEQCHFEGNIASLIGTGHGGAIGVRDVSGDGVRVHQCTFMNNESGWSGAVGLFNSNGLFEEVVFTQNSSPRQGGALRFYATNIYPNASLTVRDCSFQGNSGSFGGGLYVLLIGQSPQVTVSNTNFENNAVASSLAGWGAGGGGLCTYIGQTVNNASITVDGCLFRSNTSAGELSALGLYADGRFGNFMLTNNTFTENETTGSYATVGIWTGQGATGQALIENCTFDKNTSVSTAGLDIGSGLLGGPMDFLVRNCRFTDNHSSDIGAGIAIWGDTGSDPNFIIEDCLIEGNTSQAQAGAIWVLNGSTQFSAVVNRCRILDNYSPIGSAIGFYRTDLTSYSIPVNAAFSLENSLISGNSGEAAAIALDTFPEFRVLNTTIAHNQSNGILLRNQSGLTLQNAILYNPGFTEVEVISESSAITSLGGNLVGDGSLAGYALSYDLQNEDPLFVASDDFHLADNSPAIDKGVDLGALPETDLDGHSRINGCVDIGAYESSVVVTMECVVNSRDVIAGKVALAPNPARDFLRIQLPERISGPFLFQLFSLQGQLLEHRMIDPAQPISVEKLPGGVYLLKAVAGTEIFIGKFIKE